ncbi:MAG TPA: methylmalonyl Co-A mutase-associated GTPase MeaB [Niabella sp.]|nr:methylmalonyl Co-A mutase-associated GTPase MeaB [Chitinophagaceae bacterium]HRO84166.1 methylmalonyl Co-A mutase-associated GTPase MeaB [Niabella sp.]
MWTGLLHKIQQGDIKSLARSISLVENEVAGYEKFLQSLPASRTRVIGITGPPGAGKSTTTDALINEVIKEGKKVAVLCVDPSSPFNLGAVLGDRIRMSRWYTNDRVFIRSLATRGSMGGLNPKIIEITDILKSSDFDLIIVETVGVGQSEIEIAGLADITVVVLVPEAGDEIQTMKAGLMEIADVFAVNKSDRPGADLFVRNLRLMLAPAFSKNERRIPIVSTVANKEKGIDELYQEIKQILNTDTHKERRSWLLAEKAFHLIEKERMKNAKKEQLKSEIEKELQSPDFNLYQYVYKRM